VPSAKKLTKVGGRGPGAHGPWQGSGRLGEANVRSPRGLALDRQGGATKSQREAVPNSHNLSLSEAPIRAAREPEQ